MKASIFSIGVVIICILPSFFESVIPQIIILTAVLAFLTNVKFLKAFALAFGIASLSWFFYTGYLNIGTDFNSKIGEVFKGISVTNLKQISGLIAGISAGLGAMLGSSIRLCLPSSAQ